MESSLLGSVRVASRTISPARRSNPRRVRLCHAALSLRPAAVRLAAFVGMPVNGPCDIRKNSATDHLNPSDTTAPFVGRASPVVCTLLE